MTDSHRRFPRVSDVIDFKMGALGVVIMGSTVFGINFHETGELLGPSTAALKQAAYTFTFGGAVIKSAAHLATRISNKTKAIALAVAIPSATTLVLTYGVHNLKGTPNPEKSTIPTTLVIPATGYWAHRKRNQLDLVYEETE